MARISGVDLPARKRAEIGLTYIYGIGRTRAKSILYRTGVDADKKIAGWKHHVVGQSIMAGTMFEQGMVRNGVDGSTIEGMGEPYAVPLNLAVEGVKQNVPVLWWRSVGRISHSRPIRATARHLGASTPQGL